MRLALPTSGRGTNPQGALPDYVICFVTNHRLANRQLRALQSDPTPRRPSRRLHFDSLSHLISGCSEVFPVPSQKCTRFGAACLMLSKHSVRAMVHTGTWLKTGWLPSASPCKAKFQISITFFDLFSMQPVKFTRLKAGSSRYMFLLSAETSDNNHNYP